MFDARPDLALPLPGRVAASGQGALTISPDLGLTTVEVTLAPGGVRRLREAGFGRVTRRPEAFGVATYK